MPDLSPRLKKVSELVRPGSRVADIGTDHAYLPAYLVKNNIAKTALACDVSKGPLLNAEETVKLFGIEDRTELRLSDGFEGIYPDEADDFILCGMGGSLIAELLGRAPWLKDGKYRLIIQPQSHSNDVREFLIENGFEIITETALFDEGRVYNMMAAEYTGLTKDYPPSYIYFGSLPQNKDEASKYCVTRTLKYLKVRYEAEKDYGDPEAAQNLKAIIEDAEERINENK
jgi:tRNA (adenine22-N1)-methyltransferase